jgi:hypothetical protein
MDDDRLVETITLNQARSLIKSMAHEQSLLLLSPPGVGKSDTVMEAAREANLPFRSLLGTQIAPEDVSGIPRIVGDRSVFCPPRILLPETPEPFCLFLDELPACAPDIQKAFYSLLLERRIGEHALPPGIWVVAAGNRAEDRALVRAMSSALINRVTILNVRVDVKEWLIWARGHGVRSDILSFITFMPDALMRPVPAEPVPFSTPRAWTFLSRALDLADEAGITDSEVRRALAFGRVSAQDAAVFSVMFEEPLVELELYEPRDYIQEPGLLPVDESARWFVLSGIREAVARDQLEHVSPEKVDEFLRWIPQEIRFAVLVDLVEKWGRLGASQVMLDSLKEVTGLE